MSPPPTLIVSSMTEGTEGQGRDHINKIFIHKFNSDGIMHNIQSNARYYNVTEAFP